MATLVRSEQIVQRPHQGPAQLDHDRFLPRRQRRAGTINPNDLSQPRFFVSFIRAIIWLLIVNLVQRGRTR